MPSATQALLPLRCLGGWTAGCGGNRNPEKDIQLPGQEVAATLLEDMRLCQEYDCHHFGEGHTSVHPGIQGADASDQRTSLTVRRQHRDKSIQVSTPGGLQTPSNQPTPTPPYYPLTPSQTHHHPSTYGRSRHRDLNTNERTGGGGGWLV